MHMLAEPATYTDAGRIAFAQCTAEMALTRCAVLRIAIGAKNRRRATADLAELERLLGEIVRVGR